MVQVTPTIAAYESDIQRMTQYLAENTRPRPLHEVEQELFVMALSIGRSALQCYVDRVGTGHVGPEHRDARGTRRRFHSFQNREYRSIFGPISIRRAYYFRTGDGGVFPLEEALSLPERSYSLVLQQWVTLLAVKGPFDEGLDDLVKLLGIQVPKRMAEAIVKEAARDVATFREGLPAPENEGKILVIEADGKGIPMVRPKTPEPPGPKMRRKKGEKKNKKKMATVFTFYTMNPKKDTVPEARNRKVYAYLGTKRQAFERFAGEAKKRGIGEKPTLFLSDGDPDLAGLQAEFFPTARPCIDWIHVVEYLWQAAYVFHPEGSAEAAAWVEKRKAWLMQNKVGTIIRGLKQSLTKGKRKAAQKKTLLTVISYLEGVRHRLPYAEFYKAGYPIGTGSVEGACRHLVADRMERAGMHWKEEGAQAMLDLRAVHINGEWDEFSKHRMRREHERLYGTSGQALAA